MVMGVKCPSIVFLHISKFILILHILSTQVSDTGPLVLWFDTPRAKTTVA